MPTFTFPNGDINVEGAWDIEKGKSFIRVGIYDSGIDQTHSELQNNVGGGYDYVKNAALQAIFLTRFLLKDFLNKLYFRL